MKRSSKSKGTTKKNQGAKPRATSRNRRTALRGKVIAALTILLVLAFLGYRFFAGTGLSRKAIRAVTSERTAASETLSLDRIVGHWSRSDSPARLEIRGVRDNGLLDASYYNPRAIHIATAAAKQERDYIRVYLKLQDPSDPGSTYRLNYDPKLDSMRGDYYDAVARQMNDVAFTRSK